MRAFRARRRRAPGRSSSSWSTTDRATVPSPRSQRAHPDVQVIRAPGNVGYARAANLGTAATRAPLIAVLNADTRLEPGAAGALVRTARRRRAARRVRTAAEEPRRQRLPVGPTAAVRLRRRHARAARACGGRPTGTRRRVPADRRRARRAARRRLGLRRRAVAAPRRARRGRRVGRALLHVPRGRRSLLAAARCGLGDRLRAGRRRRPRAGREHGPAAVPDARRAPPFRVAFRPPPVHGRACAPAAVRGRVPGRARRPGDGCARLGARGESRGPPASLARLWASPLGRNDAPASGPRAGHAATSAGTSSRPSSSSRAS